MTGDEEQPEFGYSSHEMSGTPSGTDQADGGLAELLEGHRSQAAVRRESLGPLIEAATMLRACCETVRVLLDEMESAVGVHLELLDAVMRSHCGNRWWELPREEQEQ
jgi:hypothetical protein